MQYTIRNMPAEIDQALREQAAAEQKSLNQVLIDVVARGLGLAKKSKKLRDLSDIAGKRLMDEKTLAALKEQRPIDSEHWQ